MTAETPLNNPPDSEPIVLQAVDITYTRRNTSILKGIDMDVRAGEILGVIGPGSAGKTVFLNILSGKLKATAGSIQLSGADISTLSRRKRTRAGISSCTYAAPDSMVLQLATAIDSKPLVVLIDEPYKHVHPEAPEINAIRTMIKTLTDMGAALVIASRNRVDTLNYVDRAYLVEAGSVLREGTSDFLLEP